MKFFTTVLLLMIATATSAQAKESISTVAVYQPGQKWHFQDVQSYQQDGVTHIGGRMTANSRFGLPRGKIEISAFSANGDLLATTTTDYRPGVLTHRMKQKGGVKFSASFTENLPADSVIKVAFQRNEK